MSAFLVRRIGSNIRPLMAYQSRIVLPNVTCRQNYWPKRYDPFEEMQNQFNRMTREFDRILPSAFMRPQLGISRGTLLPMETYDNGKGLLKIEVDLPDFKPEEIQVTVKDGQVEVTAKSESKGDINEYREVRYSYSLPKDTEVDKVRSLLKADGRLLIEAPLPPQLASHVEDKQIPIKKE